MQVKIPYKLAQKIIDISYFSKIIFPCDLLYRLDKGIVRVEYLDYLRWKNYNNIKPMYLIYMGFIKDLDEAISKVVEFDDVCREVEFIYQRSLKSVPR